MIDRVTLHNKLKEICDNVYFQPPENIQMKFPCIVYNIYGIDSIYADNVPWNKHVLYNITYITKDPDSLDVLDKLTNLPYIEYNRYAVTDGLYHHYLINYN